MLGPITGWVHSQGTDAIQSTVPWCPPNRPFDRATCAVQGSRLEAIYVLICWNQEILREIATALASPANAWVAKNCKLRKTPEDSTETRDKAIGEGVTAQKDGRMGYPIQNFSAIHNPKHWKSNPTHPDHVPQRSRSGRFLWTWTRMYFNVRWSQANSTRLLLVMLQVAMARPITYHPKRDPATLAMNGSQTNSPLTLHIFFWPSTYPS